MSSPEMLVPRVRRRPLDVEISRRCGYGKAFFPLGKRGAICSKGSAVRLSGFFPKLLLGN
jgi:hypothetical protein